MECHVYTTRDFRDTHWGAGTTSEMFIFPEGASYAERRFDLRLSSATICTESSEFTSLPGVERWICPLDGYLEIEHPEQKVSYRLAPYDLHHFDGGEKTLSHGCVRDFNIMSKLGRPLRPVRLRRSECRLMERCNHLLIFSYEGSRVATGSRQDGSCKAEPADFSFTLTLPPFSLLDLRIADQDSLHLKNIHGGTIIALPLFLNTET